MGCHYLWNVLYSYLTGLSRTLEKLANILGDGRVKHRDGQGVRAALASIGARRPDVILEIGVAAELASGCLRAGATDCPARARGADLQSV